jgi:hypothetical protein
LIWEQSIQKIRDYLNSLSFERRKKKVRKVLDTTNGDLSDIMNQDLDIEDLDETINSDDSLDTGSLDTEGD